MSDPVRLLGSSRDRVTRALLESAVSPGPTNAECDALWGALATRLPQAVVVGAAAGTAGGALAKVATSKAIALGVLAKSVLAIAVVGSVAAVGVTRPWKSLREGAPPVVASTREVSQAAAPPPIARAPVTPADLPVAVDEAPSPPPPRAPAPRARSLPSASAPSPSSPVPPETTLQTESASLLRGRQLLRSGDCEGALTQLQESAARFPRGGLAQEREVLAVEALACVGRAPEAAARADAFLHDHPASAHAPKVRRFATNR